MHDLFPPREHESNGNGRRREIAAYDYVDESGVTLYQKVRYEPKGFAQRRPDGAGGWIYKLGDTRQVIYRLPKVVAAIASSQPIYLVEGEKDVHAVEKAGGVATTSPLGAGNWRDEFTDQLAGAIVTIIADRDDAGRAHAKTVSEALGNAPILEPASGKDVSDHLAEGLTLADLVPPSEAKPLSASVIEIQKKYPLMTWSEFRDTSPEHTEWLVEGILAARQQAFIGAPAKYGKTWVAGDLAVSVVTGTPFLGRYAVPSPAPVIYLALEGQLSALRTRFGCLSRGHGINPGGHALDNLYLRPRTPGINLADPSWSDWVIEEVRSTGAKLLVIDVLRKAMPQLRESGDGATDFSNLIANLAPIAELGCAIEFLHHFLKRSDGTKDRSVLEMLVGSGALGGHADSVIGIGKREKDGQLIRRLMAEMDGRDEATPEPFTINLDGAATGQFGGWCYEDTLTLCAVQDEPTKKRIDKRELLSIRIVTWICGQPDRQAKPADIRSEFTLAEDELYNLRRDYLDPYIDVEGAGPSTRYVAKDGIG